MSDVTVQVFARTDVGLHRAGNEDAFMVADLTTGKVGLGPEMSTHHLGDRGSLLVVSDGMGGAVAGEVASALAVKTMRESLLELPLDMLIPERLRMAAEEANERVWNHAQENPQLAGMGATLTAVLVHLDTAYVAQVGDSRAYLVRGEQIKQLTKDQSLVQMLIDSGAIQPDQASSVPQNVIMQALGTQQSVKVAMSAVALCRNDYLLVCSDGLSNKIQAEEMRQVVLGAPDLTAACRKLVDTANERGGEDNITVIVARFDGVGLHSASESSSITGSFRNLNGGYVTDRGPGMPPPYTPPPPTEDITTMVMQSPIYNTQPFGGAPPAFEEGPVSEVEDLLARPAPAPPMDYGAPHPAPRKSYAIVWVIGIVSALLLAAASYIIYTQVISPPSPSDPPINESQPPPADSPGPTPGQGTNVPPGTATPPDAGTAPAGAQQPDPAQGQQPAAGSQPMVQIPEGSAPSGTEQGGSQPQGAAPTKQQ